MIGNLKNDGKMLEMHIKNPTKTRTNATQTNQWERETKKILEKQLFLNELLNSKIVGKKKNSR